MVFVNRYGCYHFASPFGGFKQSGWGKELAHGNYHRCERSPDFLLILQSRGWVARVISPPPAGHAS